MQTKWKKWADLRLRCCCVFCGVSFLLLLPSSSLMVVLLLFQLEERKMYQMKDVVSLDINFYRNIFSLIFVIRHELDVN